MPGEPPYIDVIDVARHAPLRPWKTPVSSDDALRHCKPSAQAPGVWPRGPLRQWGALPGRALRRRKWQVALAANAQGYRATPWSVSPPDNDSVGQALGQNYHPPVSMTSLSLSLASLFLSAWLSSAAITRLQTTHQ